MDAITPLPSDVSALAPATGRLDETLLRTMTRAGGTCGFRELATRAGEAGIRPAEVLAWLADARIRGLIVPVGFRHDRAGRPTGPMLWAAAPPRAVTWSRPDPARAGFSHDRRSGDLLVA